MKVPVLVLALCAAAQALPATLTSGEEPQAPTASTVAVAGDADLQKAIDAARGGDVIELPPGAVFSGNFVLPRTEGTRYITIRTAGSSGLPGPGGRIGPQHSRRLARIQSPNSTPAIRTAPGASYWRLSLLEFGPNANGAGDIIAFGDASPAQTGGDRTPHHLIVDRCYIHGDPVRGQKRGIALNSASTIVTGSHISDIKAVGQDAQAIAGWSGPGPFRIENNYLEASGENFMLGGATPAERGLIPSDVVFRRNHVARPPGWMDERWTVKNLFELKNARRVLVEGNLFENHWAGAQPGFAIVFTPRGENGAAPWATIEDVTFQYNVVRNVAAVFNLLGRDDSAESGRMRRIRIAHNLMYAVDRNVWKGNGAFMQIGGGPSEVVVEHNTVIHTGNVLTLYGGTRANPDVLDGFTFRDNLMLHNANGVIAQGMGVGTDSLTAYVPNGTFVRNVLAGGRESRYPAGNLFPDPERFQQQFAGYAAGDYRLRPESEFRRAASDGTDLGVDFAALAKALGTRAREWLGLPGSSR